ncbi:hypothetical protein RSAG8_01425, partial [Rhizoctonia solani AG-8 WAC10335]
MLAAHPRHSSICLWTSPTSPSRFPCSSATAVATRSMLAAGSKTALIPLPFPHLRSCLGFKFLFKLVLKYFTTGWILFTITCPFPPPGATLQLFRPSFADFLFGLPFLQLSPVPRHVSLRHMQLYGHSILSSPSVVKL